MADVTAYVRAVGERLRAVRNRAGLSLNGVEAKSHGRWTAPAVGSYERADRALTIQKLAELAEFYGVPVVDLLPPQRQRHRLGNVEEQVWRVGRSVGRTVYRQLGDDPAKGDQLIGTMDTPELAARVVDAVNARNRSPVTGRELERLILQAICDPGAFLPRGDDYTEAIPHWGMRAVFAALKRAGLAIAAESELDDYRMLTPQSCDNKKHTDWLVDSENHHACPWCRIEKLEQALAAEALAAEADLDQVDPA